MAEILHCMLNKGGKSILMLKLVPLCFKFMIIPIHT